MNVEEMKNHEWSISWSGGKDSTTTVILCHEYGIPIKEILYVKMMYDEELPATLPIMTDFVDNAIKVFENWGYKVRVVKSLKTAKQLIERRYKKSKYEDRNGKQYGITTFLRGFCNFTNVKQKTIKNLFYLLNIQHTNYFFFLSLLYYNYTYLSFYIFYLLIQGNVSLNIPFEV